MKNVYIKTGSPSLIDWRLSLPHKDSCTGHHHRFNSFSSSTMVDFTGYTSNTDKHTVCKASFLAAAPSRSQLLANRLRTGIVSTTGIALTLFLSTLVQSLSYRLSWLFLSCTDELNLENDDWFAVKWKIGWGECTIWLVHPHPFTEHEQKRVSLLVLLFLQQVAKV